MLNLRVGGLLYSGWKRIRVTRGIESIAGSFELSVSDRWNGQKARWNITEESECSVEINDEPVITGVIDKRRISFAAQEHTLEISGRDATAALVDCSAVLGAWEFKNISIEILAGKLCAPFGISVSLDASTSPRRVTLGIKKGGGAVSGAGKAGHVGIPKPQAKTSINPGESLFEVLERAARMAGVLLISDGNGGLIIARPGTDRAATALVEGKNILAASADYDASGRYYRYVVSGQQQGSDDWDLTEAAAVSAEAHDPGVSRTSRVLLIRPEGSVTRESARQRSQWEASVRAARGDSVTVTVQGWTQADGSLWAPNMLAQVKSPTLGVDGTLLITEVTYSLDESGTVTQIKLKRPDAFKPEPVVSLSGGLWKEIANGVKL